MHAEFVPSPMKREETIKKLVISAMMSMFAAPNDKTGESDKDVGWGEGLRLVVETVLDVGTMDPGGDDPGGGEDSCKELEKDMCEGCEKKPKMRMNDCSLDAASSCCSCCGCGDNGRCGGQSRRQCAVLTQCMQMV